jgi:hypothetical protein
MSQDILTRLQQQLLAKYGNRIQVVGHYNPAQIYAIDGHTKIEVLTHQWGATDKAAFQVNYRKGWIIAKHHQDDVCVQKIIDEIEAVRIQQELKQTALQQIANRREHTIQLLSECGIQLPNHQKHRRSCDQGTMTITIDSNGRLELTLCVDPRPETAFVQALVQQLSAMFPDEVIS